MNQIELMKKRNDVARKVIPEDRMKRNCVRLHPQNTKRHEMKKAELCYQLLTEGKEFITEARFHNNTRADVLVLDDDMAFEVETNPKDFEMRKKDYPVDVELVVV